MAYTFSKFNVIELSQLRPDIASGKCVFSCDTHDEAKAWVEGLENSHPEDCKCVGSLYLVVEVQDVYEVHRELQELPVP
jgi:hypothetical protein